jgi:site-specific DNA recombinase
MTKEAHTIMPAIPTRTKAIGYVRVSTEKQVEKGVSLKAQQDKLAAYAGLYDIDLVEIIIDDGVSAKTLDRPGLARALSMLKKGEANALLICKLNRLTRSVKDLGILVEKYFSSDKITLLSVADSIDTHTAAGRMVLNTLGTVAQWERETISERTTEALAYKRAHGQRTGGDLPYGYMGVAEDGKTLVEDLGEQAVIASIRSYRQEGLSLRRICAIVHRQGVRPAKGHRSV